MTITESHQDVDHNRWAEAPTPTDRAGWVQRAREVAAQFEQTAVERDHDARPPSSREIQWLKDSKLLGVAGPVQHGGGNVDWLTVLEVIAEFAKVEGSIANILGWHYEYFQLFRLYGTPEQQEHWERVATTDQLLIGGITNIRDAPILVTRVNAEELAHNGSKTFNTGLPGSDLVIFTSAFAEAQDDLFFTVVETNQPGIVANDDWDTLGQRSTGSGSAFVSDVRTGWNNLLGFRDGQFVPRPGNFVPGLFQTVIVTFYISLARGALAKAVEYTRTKSRAWVHGPYDRAVDEPHIVDGYGELQSRLLAAEALAWNVAREVSEELQRPHDISVQRRAELAAKIAAAKVIAVEVGLDVTSRVFEFTGARATARSFGLDRYWRDLRTHSLHDPLGYKRRQVGAYLLKDEFPPSNDWYS
jgi:alkylation response protein AidB-like acyl-CoA dehydrogenase